MDKIDFSDRDIEEIDRMIKEFGLEVEGLPKNPEEFIPYEYEPDFLFSISFEEALQGGLISVAKEQEVNAYRDVFERTKQIYGQINEKFSNKKITRRTEKKLMQYILLFDSIVDSLIYGDLREACESLEQLEEHVGQKHFG